MTHCCAALRVLGLDASTMEEAAGRVVRFLYDELADPRTNTRGCTLVRFYKTHHYRGLDPERRRFARAALDGRVIAPTTRCLTLLASAGDEPSWNDPQRSKHHLTIPLVGEGALSRAPMLGQLLTQLGVNAGSSRSANAEPKADGRSYDVVLVPEAKKSPYLPAQRDFIERYGVRSAIGFGGSLLTSDIFAVALFSRASIAASARDLFKTIALGVKLAVLPFSDRTIFASSMTNKPQGKVPCSPSITK